MRIIIDLLVAHLEVVHLIFNIPIVNLNYKYYEKVFISICFFIAFFLRVPITNWKKCLIQFPFQNIPKKL